MFRFTQNFPRFVMIISESPVDRWLLLYHSPPIPLHGSKGYFPRGLGFTKMYGNFSQVIPELQDKVFQDFCLPTFPVLAS